MVLSACGTDPVSFDAQDPGTGDREIVDGPVFDVASESIDADSDPILDVHLPGTLGGSRPAPVFLPSEYDHSRSWPLILLIHGYAVNGFVQDVYLGLSQRVDVYGFIEVLPEGLVDPSGKQFWNAFGSNAPASAPDDSAYLRSLIDEALATFNVDESRIIVAGHSNGGFMAYRMACDHADVVTAIAPIAGTLFGAWEDCNPSRPVSLLHMHGTGDAAVKWDGGTWIKSYCGVDEAVEHWRTLIGCSGETVPGGPMDWDIDVAGSETSTAGWLECDGGTQVELWAMEGSGHIPALTDECRDTWVERMLSLQRL